MPQFAYRARGSEAQLVEGMIEADSPEAALQTLDRMGYSPMLLREANSAASKPIPSFTLRRRPSKQQLTTFTRQLSDLLGAGIVLAKALDTLSRQTAHPMLRGVVEDLRERVKGGTSFSSALSAHPQLFSPLYVHLVEAGEVSGTLDTVLSRLVEFGEKEEELVSKIRNALAYPLLILFFGMATLCLLLVFVVPRLSSLFDDFQAALPLPTRILIGISYLLTHFGWLLGAGAVGGILLWQRSRASEQGRRWMGRLLLKVPVMGELSRRSEIARFGRTLGTLVANGIPLLSALELVSRSVTNLILQRKLEEAVGKVREGSSLAVALSQTGEFPLFVTNMIAVGEEAGSLEKSLFKVADTYDREVDRATRLFTTLLGPMLILVMAVVVGFIVVSMLLPIFELQGILK